MMTASSGSSRVRSISTVASEAPSMAGAMPSGARPARGRVIGGGMTPFTRNAANDGAWKMNEIRGALRFE